jgi:non-ribosomal peptide synthetase component E (peptide arylation enzyme)
MAQVLKDVKVVEHGTFITGPAASMLLADLGADVVKVELPVTGDPFRAYKGELYSPHFQTYNRNKRSITLNTKDKADLARFDEDGFLYIEGRLSRFSKIGGEMVPHIQIEEAITQFVGDNEGQISVAVTSVPDEKKGERLIVLHTEISKTPAEITKALSEIGLPNLFIPSQDSFIKVEAIPILGTGKLDLRGLQQMAKDLLNE